MTRISLVAAGLVAGIGLPGYASAKPFTDYFKPVPIFCPAHLQHLGDVAVIPRDTCNGLEDTSGTPTVRPNWMSWDGKILRGADGKYHMFADRWPHANGMGDWVNSETVPRPARHCSDPLWNKGTLQRWPDATKPHKGRNGAASDLPDGTYCLIVNEIVTQSSFLGIF